MAPLTQSPNPRKKTPHKPDPDSEIDPRSEDTNAEPRRSKRNRPAEEQTSASECPPPAVKRQLDDLQSDLLLVAMGPVAKCYLDYRQLMRNIDDAEVKLDQAEVPKQEGSRAILARLKTLGHSQLGQLFQAMSQTVESLQHLHGQEEATTKAAQCSAQDET